MKILKIHMLLIRDLGFKKSYRNDVLNRFEFFVCKKVI